MKLTFYGGAGSVTGACYLVETKTVRILVDCGLVQGGYVAEKINYQKFPFNPGSIDYVFITHGHLDHVGRVPKLYKDGFKGLVFATYPTCDFSEIILYDSQNILNKEAKAMRRKPIYSEEDVRRVSELFHGVEYGEKVKVNDSLTFRFRDAGHILGSGIIEIWLEDKKLVFSGDLGNTTSTLLRPMEIIDKADFIVMESLYGDRAHETKNERKAELEKIIEDTVAKGGVIMIPAFAIERTQELLYELNELVENKRIPPMPMFLDSPLSIEATAIYKKYPQYYGEEAKGLIKSGDALFDFHGLNLTRTRAESMTINDVASPKVIIAGSGMLEGGRIWHHLKRYLSDPKNLLLIISYQAPGSRGRKLLDGAKNIRIFDANIPVGASVVKIDGYSAHADREQLIKFVSRAKKGLKKVFMVQGEEKSAESLAAVVRDRLGVMAIAPKLGDSYEL